MEPASEGQLKSEQLSNLNQNTVVVTSSFSESQDDTHIVTEKQVPLAPIATRAREMTTSHRHDTSLRPVDDFVVFPLT